MFFLAEGEAAAAAAPRFDVFDIFMIVFTVIIAWGVLRSLKARPQNKFAIGFGIVALLTFLVMDGIMFMHWLGMS